MLHIWSMDGEKNKSQITCFMYDQWMVKKTSIQKKKKNPQWQSGIVILIFSIIKVGSTDR